MRTLVFALVVFTVIGLTLGSLFGVDNGYLLISWGNYVIETNLGIALLLTAIGVFILYIGVRFLLVLIGNDWRFNDWRRKRRNDRARRQTALGLLSLTQGQWRRAERLLSLNAEDSDTPLINYLAAAHAAAEQNNFNAAEQWLNAAQKSTQGAELATGIMQAELLNLRGQYEQALAILLKLRPHHPKHSHLLKTLVQTVTALEDWRTLQELLPQVRKHANIEEKTLDELEHKVQIQLLERERNQHNPSKLKHAFHAFPRSARANVLLNKRYIELLLSLGEERLAAEELRQILKYCWHEDLLRMYGQVQGKDPQSQLLFAEKQITERTNDPVLLLVLGQLAARIGQMQKAEDYWMTGLTLRNLPELHQELAKLRLAEGDEHRACEHFQQALP